MTLAYIVSLISSLGVRQQAPRLDILHALDSAQKIAFAKDCRAFIRNGELGENGSLPDDCREVIDCGGIVDMFERRADQPEGAAVQYYRRAPSLTANDGVPLEDLDYNVEFEFAPIDEAKIIVPDEWRRQVLIEPAIALLDSGLYAEKAPQALLDGYFKEWWQAMDARPVDRIPLESTGAW